MPPRSGAKILNKLNRILRGKTVLLGIGNTLRGDDGFGSALARRLSPVRNLKRETEYFMRNSSKISNGVNLIRNLKREAENFMRNSSKISNRVNSKINLKVFDGGLSPENFLGTIIAERPDTVLVIDAVDFGGTPAEIRLFDLERVKTENFFLTHNTSISLLLDFLKAHTKTKAYLLAIQPKEIGFSDKMSPEMEARLEELELWFLERYPIINHCITNGLCTDEKIQISTDLPLKYLCPSCIS